MKKYGLNYRRLTMRNERKSTDDNIIKILHDPSKVTKIIQAGIRTALLKHKQAGNPVCEWRNNKVVWIAPENIPNFDKIDNA